MADNLDEEALDNPINHRSKSLSDEIISTILNKKYQMA